jgi:septal ring factor EnvC (AmiA/AmiB activator)
MDPISIVGLVATTGSLILLTGRVATGIHTIMDKCDQLSTTMTEIEEECTMLQASYKRMKSWIELQVNPSQDLRDAIPDLENAINICENSLKRLEAEIYKIASRVSAPSTSSFTTLGNKAKIRFLWNEDTMKGHLSTVRWHGSALHLLLSASKL